MLKAASREMQRQVEEPFLPERAAVVSRMMRGES
jgi:hypothetical protein